METKARHNKDLRGRYAAMAILTIALVTVAPTAACQVGTARISLSDVAREVELLEQQIAALEAGLAPIGTIVVWHGSVAEIPAGWALCDGRNGTPDLSELFVVGAHQGLPPGTNGGTITHAHGSRFAHEHGMNHFHTLARLEPQAGGNHLHSLLAPSLVHDGLQSGSHTPGWHNHTHLTEWDGVHPHSLAAAAKTDPQTISLVGLAHSVIQSAEHLPAFYRKAFIIKIAA